MAQVDGNIGECVKHQTPVLFRNLLEIQTISVQTSAGVGRLTKLSEIDFHIGEEEVTPLPQMHMLVVAWYVPDQELVEEMLKDMREAKEKQLRQIKEMESGLSQVQAVPKGFPGMPPGMGGFRPPGRR